MSIRFSWLKWLSFVFLILTIPAALFIPDIAYRSEITDYFKPDDPQVREFKALEDDLGTQASLLVLLKAPEPSFLSPSYINSLNVLSAEIRKQAGVVRVQSLLSTAVTNQDEDILSLSRYLQLQQALTPEIFAQLQENVRNSLLLSEQGDVASMQVFFKDAETIASVYPQIKATLEKHFVEPGLGSINLLGPVEIKQALIGSMLHDAVYLMPLVLIIGLGVIWYFVRSVWLVFAGSISVIVALWLTAGVIGALGFTLNQTSSLAFGIVFIIALADVIHLLTSYAHQPPGSSDRDAMLAALRSNLPALFLTSVTTAIGFLSLNWSASPVFATFGNVAAIGIAFAFLSAITVTTWLGTLRSASHIRGENPDALQKCVNWLECQRRKMSTRAYAVFYVATLVISSCAFLNVYHNDPLNYFSKDTDIIKALSVSEKSFSMHHPLSVRIDSSMQDGVFDPEYLKTMTAFQQWLDGNERVALHHGYLNVLAQLKRQLFVDDEEGLQPITTDAEAAEYWNLYQMAAPENTELSLGIDAQFRSAVVTVGVPEMLSSDLMAFRDQVVNWFAQHAPSGYAVSVSGHAILFASLGKDLTRNMFIGGLVSAMIISLLIGLFLGSMKLGVISLIPNLLPAGLVFGFWGMSVGVIDIAAAGTLSICLGIVVDDCIHILKRYTTFRRSGYNAEQSMSMTLEQTGSALVLTTIILALGMLVLTLSIFKPNQEMAILMAWIVVVALLYDLLLLPHLLEKCDRWIFKAEPSQTQADSVSG